MVGIYVIYDGRSVLVGVSVCGHCQDKPTMKPLSVLLNEIECRKGVAARFAAEHMDWTQVVLNGGPPCFHVCDDQHFCGRAERWDGHGEPEFHDFISLADLIHSARTDVPALVKALRRAIKLAKWAALYPTEDTCLADIIAILNREKQDLGE